MATDGTHTSADRVARTSPTIILLHGYGCSSDDWVEVTERLHSRRVVAVDLPGHGHNREPPAETLDQMVAFVDRVLPVGPERSVLVGHSLGGMIGLALALRQPRRLAGLVLADAFPHLGSVVDVFGGPESIEDPFGFGAVIDRQTQPAIAARVRTEMGAGVRRAGAELFDSILRFDVRDSLSGLSTPTLLILGNRRWVDRERLPGVLDRLGFGGVRSLQTVLVDSHHFVMLEQPDETAAAIDRMVDFVAMTSRDQG